MHLRLIGIGIFPDVSCLHDPCEGHYLKKNGLSGLLALESLVNPLASYHFPCVIQASSSNSNELHGTLQPFLGSSLHRATERNLTIFPYINAPRIFIFHPYALLLQRSLIHRLDCLDIGILIRIGHLEINPTLRNMSQRADPCSGMYPALANSVQILPSSTGLRCI